MYFMISCFPVKKGQLKRQFLFFLDADEVLHDVPEIGLLCAAAEGLLQLVVEGVELVVDFLPRGIRRVGDVLERGHFRLRLGEGAVPALRLSGEDSGGNGSSQRAGLAGAGLPNLPGRCRGGKSDLCG